MKIERSFTNKLHAVFQNSSEADKWEWLFWRILRRPRSCFNGYDNAYCLY